MNGVHVERLRTLYALMAGIPANRVNLRSWRCGMSSGSTSDYGMRDHSCKSTGCAIGWACAYPEFNEQGLVWEDGSPVLRVRKTGNVFHDWRAAEEFFGLSVDQAEYLFDDDKRPYDLNSPNKDSQFPNLKCHKRLILARIRYHLLHIGAITYGRYLQLGVQEVRETLTP